MPFVRQPRDSKGADRVSSGVDSLLPPTTTFTPNNTDRDKLQADNHVSTYKGWLLSGHSTIMVLIDVVLQK